MEIVLVIGRIFLASIFLVAGIAKAADREGSRQAMIDFGVPERFAAPFSWSLPYVEIIIALAMLPLATAWWGAIGALALLLIFIVGIGLNLARGRSPDCRCFGQLHSEPVGWKTFARNLSLSAVAGFIVVQGNDNSGLSAVNWLSHFSAAEIINLILGISLIGLLTAAIILLSRMLKQQSKLLGGIETIRAALDLDEDGEPLLVVKEEAILPDVGLPIGAVAPKFSLTGISGEKMSFDDLLGQSKSLLLLFTGPNCWGCKLLLPAVRVWQRDYGDHLTVAVLSQGSLKENQAKMLKYEINHVLLDEAAKVANDYQAIWTPAAVLINPDGKIASLTIYGDNAIREGIRNLIASGQLPTGASNGKGAMGHVPQVSIRYSVREIGETALSFSLPDLSGKTVSMKDLIGRPTLLLFWHPLCDYCKGMFDDLRRWEDSPPEVAPELVLIASGRVEDIRVVNEKFKSPTLLDPSFEIAKLYGTKFTPSAILIDGDGKVASSLAMGDQNVRALIGLPKAELQATTQL